LSPVAAVVVGQYQVAAVLVVCWHLRANLYPEVNQLQSELVVLLLQVQVQVQMEVHRSLLHLLNA
jgi:hypothetical protein